MKNKFELLKEVVEAVDNGNSSTVGSILEVLKENGIIKNMHVGKQKEIVGFFENEIHVAEWYLGNFYTIIDNQSYFAMNSLLNQASAYLERLQKEKPELFTVTV